MKNLIRLGAAWICCMTTGFVLQAQPIDCEDIRLVVGYPTDPAPVNCSGGGDDCFQIAFPVFFQYIGEAYPAPTSFQVSSLTIEGDVSGLGVTFDYGQSRNGACIYLDNLSLPDNAFNSDNHFKYVNTAGATVSFGNQGNNHIFLMFMDARPNEGVTVDVGSVSFVIVEGLSSTPCTLEENPEDPNKEYQIADLDGNNPEEDPYPPLESDGCAESGVALTFGTQQIDDDYIRIPLLFTQTSGGPLNISNLDFSVDVEDVYGNVQVEEFLANTGGGFQFEYEVTPSAQGYEVYCKMLDGPSSFFSTTFLGDLKIMRPTASNEAISVNLSYDYARIKNQSDGECCQPDFPIEKEIQIAGDTPCSTSFPVRIQPATQIPSDEDACLLYYDLVLSDEEIEVTRLELDVEFTFDGEITLADYIYDEQIFNCPAIACPNESCIAISNGNTFELNLCDASILTIPAETTIRLVFESEQDGACIRSGVFRYARIQQYNSSACLPEYYNTEESVCLDRVTGTIKTEIGNEVGEASVMGTQSCENSGTTTECDGTFAFCPDCPNQDMILAPEKDDDADCGVTTYDMVLITRHILTTTLLDSPYKIIAADANRSGTVSTLDLVAIRKVILYIEESFPNNTSWRFVDAAYSFQNSGNPFEDEPPFPEFVQLDRSTTPTEAGFIGVKIGDVNLNCTTCNGDDPETESPNPVVFEVPDKSYQTDDTIFMAFSPDTIYSLAAFQLGLKFDDSYLTFLDAQTVDLSEIDTSAFNLNDASEAKLRVVWVNDSGLDQTLTTNDKLFRYRFIAKSAISDISQYVLLDDDVLFNAAYDTSGLRYPVQLDFDPNLDGRSLSKDTPSVIQKFRFWPNPAENTLWVQFELDQSSPVNLQVSDYYGKTVWKREEPSCAPGAHAWKVPLDQLPPGIYFANLGQEVFRFVKK